MLEKLGLGSVLVVLVDITEESLGVGGERDERHISSSSLLSFRKINNIRVIGPGGVQLDNDKKFDRCIWGQFLSVWTIL